MHRAGDLPGSGQMVLPGSLVTWVEGSLWCKLPETPQASPSPQLCCSPARPMQVTLGCPHITPGAWVRIPAARTRRGVMRFPLAALSFPWVSFPEDDLRSHLLFPYKTCNNSSPNPLCRAHSEPHSDPPFPRLGLISQDRRL